MTPKSEWGPVRISFEHDRKKCHFKFLSRVTNDLEEKEIAAGEVKTSILVGGSPYNLPLSDTDPAPEPITLGSEVSISFTNIGELDSGYYIESCTATDTDTDTDDAKVELIVNGCPLFGF